MENPLFADQAAYEALGRLLDIAAATPVSPGALPTSFLPGTTPKKTAGGIPPTSGTWMRPLRTTCSLSFASCDTPSVTLVISGLKRKWRPCGKPGEAAERRHRAPEPEGQLRNKTRRKQQ